MKIAALIIGIDGWEQYTLPLIESIQRYEPDTEIVVIDNGSTIPYPPYPFVRYTARTCYAKAINTAATFAPDADWYIILSNDVVCNEKFHYILQANKDDSILGEIHHVNNIPFAMGWCVFTRRKVFEEVDGWDENYVVSSWEDVDYSMIVRRSGYDVTELVTMPFTHLDQRQRFGMPEFQGTHERNKQYFMKKWGLS